MDTDKDDASEQVIDLCEITGRFHAAVDAELASRLAAWPPDFNHVQVHEVIGAMLARQATLVKSIADAPPTWTVDIAPVLLRAIADVYINIAWLLLKPQERCLQFIAFGLGQAKLELEHRRTEVLSREPTPDETAMLSDLEEWINSQRATFLQDVNLGSWSGTSVRKMAEEAGCLDFYSFVYTPFSACAHSMWHHIAKYNMITCSNPLHRYHRRPTSQVADLDPNFLLRAAKYWAKTLNTFDERTGIVVKRCASYPQLVAEFNESAGAKE
jgi:hypothetical protein